MTATVNIEFKVASEQALQKLNGLTAGMSQMGKAANQDAAGALGVFGISLSSLNQPLTLVAETLKQSVTAAANWGDSMGDLAQMTGASVRDTSKLAATFELVGVKSSTLEAAIKSMTKNGLALNMETIKGLARQYQELQDPVAKNEFLFKNFGKAGMEMAEIMGRDTAELDRLGAAALRSGKVIGDDAAGAAEEFNTNMSILAQRVEGAQIAIGNALIPTLNAAAQSFDTLVSIGEIMGATFLENIGVMDATTAQAARLAAAGIDPVAQSTAALTTETGLMTTAMDLAADEIIGLKEGADIFAADMAMQKRLEDLTGAASDLKFGMGELTTATLFNQAAMGLDSDAAYALAKSMGLIKPDADAAKQILDGLRAELERGAITTGEYEGKVKLLDLAIRSLPDGKTITMDYVERYTKEFNDSIDEGRNAQGGSVTGSGWANKKNPLAGAGRAIGDGYGPGGANGLDFIVPPGYPNDSFPFRAQSGERVTVTPAGQPAPGGNTYILNVNSTQGSLGIANDFALMKSMATV